MERASAVVEKPVLDIASKLVLLKEEQIIEKTELNLVYEYTDDRTCEYRCSPPNWFTRSGSVCVQQVVDHLVINELEFCRTTTIWKYL